MALTKDAYEILLAYTAVAQNTMAKSSEKDWSAKYYGAACIETFLDTATAHTGTRVIIEVYNGKKWVSFAEKIMLIGTANIEPITNNPLAVSETSITCVSTTGYVNGALFGIEDATLGNSEICRIAAVVTNTSITINDGVLYQHIQNTNMYSIAEQWFIEFPIWVKRIRFTIDNTYDADGSTLNVEISLIPVSKV